MIAGIVSVLIGSAGAILLAGIAWLVARYCGHLPPRWRVGRRAVSDIVLALAIVAMLLAGTEMAFAGAGSWVVDVLMWVRGLLGTAGGTIFALITLGLLLALAVHVLKAPGEKGLMVAFLLPLFMATFAFGLFHNIDMFLAPYAEHATAAAANALGA
jgi:hypothetical protein